MVNKKEFYFIRIEKEETLEREGKRRYHFSYNQDKTKSRSYFEILSREASHYNFSKGQEFLGEFSISGMPDFVGEEDKEENICTWTLNLEKILNRIGQEIISFKK